MYLFTYNLLQEEHNSAPKRKKDRKSVRFADEVDGTDEEEQPTEEGYDFRDAEDGDVEEDDIEGSLKTAKDLFKDSDEESDDQQRLSSFEKKQKKVKRESKCKLSQFFLEFPRIDVP